VEIFTGQQDSPYHRYAQALKTRIEDDFPGSAVTVTATSGSSDNLDRLRDRAAALCKIAVTQFNVAVDARYGVYDFEGKPVKELRTVGPLWFDLVQLVVRRDSGIDDVKDLVRRQEGGDRARPVGDQADRGGAVPAGGEAGGRLCARVGAAGAVRRA
jgi:TRAP-type uncharacterized transport system substrate-binding protein